LWINHVGNCIRIKSPFADWSTDNCNRQNKKSVPIVIIETHKYNKGGFTPQSEKSSLPVKTLHTCQSCIYRCWVCVIFFARVVVSERLRRVRRGVRGGVQGFGGSAPEFFFFGPTYFCRFRADILSSGRHISGTT
jgi:hypothetical protein